VECLPRRAAEITVIMVGVFWTLPSPGRGQDARSSAPTPPSSSRPELLESADAIYPTRHEVGGLKARSFCGSQSILGGQVTEAEVIEPAGTASTRAARDAALRSVCARSAQRTACPARIRYATPSS